MKLIKIIEKDIYNTLAVVRKDNELSIIQIDNINDSILKIWELPKEDIKKYL